jgi:hypothetical protein|tara:strand:+ start:838 stop:1155 length:318 start_codon:yes stop_codon:yes gene_type:complete
MVGFNVYILYSKEFYIMVEPINSQGIDIWSAKFDNVVVDVSPDGQMTISVRTGLFDTDGNKVAESRPSKSSGKTDVVATTGGNIPIMTLPSGKVLTLGFTAYVKK